MAPRDPHSVSDLEQGRVERLDWRFRIDFEAKTLLGEATLTLAQSQQGPLDLDTRDLIIESVSDEDGEPLRWSLGTTAGFMGAPLRIFRDRPLRSLTVRYQTSPTASALQWLDPATTASGRHPYLFSQCQPIHARSMLPIQDTPRARFAYQAEVTVPAPLQVVMSAAPGQLVSDDDDAQSTFRFAMPQPIPSYLLAVAAGEIVHHELGPRCRVYAEPSVIEAAAWEFAEVEQMLEAAEGLFGPYPWERFDFIVMPPGFPYGGMENPRLTFLTPTLLAGDRSLVDVLAHELAHSWTGNLVTNATMNDFWLNEGFTVWAERRILERLRGKEPMALAAAIGRHELEAAIERAGAESPLTHLQTDLAGIDPDEVYSVVPYEKGFFFVSLLEATLGRPAFDQLLRRYLDHFRFMSIDTEEFEAFFEREAPGLLAKAGAPRWIHGPGLPDNCTPIRSAQLEQLEALAAGWSEGLRPQPSEAAGWSVSAWQIYLQRLPRPLSAADCGWLEQELGLGARGNAEIRCGWLEIAAASAYLPAWDALRSFLSSTGRMKYLKPLYGALAASEATRPLALEIFEAAKASYHPIARSVLEKLLG